MQPAKSYAYVIERAEDGGYWAYFPDLPGCAATGDSPEPLEHQLHEAVDLYLGYFHERYTDDWPPIATLKAVPKWVHAYGEEGRSGQDETTIKPQSQQEKIDRKTAYSTADIWLADGRIVFGLLFLDAGKATAIEVLESDKAWHVSRNSKTGGWAMSKYRNDTGVVIPDTRYFPIKYCSRLPFEKNRPIKGIIGNDGIWSEWVIE